MVCAVCNIEISDSLGSLCVRGHQGRILGCARDLRTAWGSMSEGTSREDPGMSKGSSGQLGQPVSEGTPREDPGTSKGSSGQLGQPVSEGTPREDPGMFKGSSGQLGSLCLKGRGHQGRIQDVLDTL